MVDRVRVGLLTLNYWAGSHATQAPSRVRAPYSPFFLQQVRSGACGGDHRKVIRRLEIPATARQIKEFLAPWLKHQ